MYSDRPDRTAHVLDMSQETESVVKVTFKVWGLSKMGENCMSSWLGWRVRLMLRKEEQGFSWRQITFEILFRHPSGNGEWVVDI